MLMSLASGTITGFVAVALFLGPGLLLLRRNQLVLVERFVMGVGLSVAASTGVLTTLGLMIGLSTPVLLVGTALLVVASIRFPFPPGSLRSAGGSPIAEMSAAVLFALAAVQVLRPAVFTTFDAQALWTPLADGIARSGDLAPTWVPSILKGLPPGVALLSGAISVPTGHLNEPAALLLPPAFGALTLLVAALLAGRFRVRGAAAMTVAIVIATPLLARAIAFHDDFIAAFLVTTAVYLAVAATRWPGWMAAGIVAGGALAVKPPGFVGCAFVVVMLCSRRSGFREWVAAGFGAAVALPWYLGNVVRFGDPIYPFLSTGSDRALRLIVEDHAAFLAGREPDQLELVGWLALALISVGLAVGLVYLARRARRLALGLVVVLVVCLAAWKLSHYGTRQLLEIYPVYGAVGGVGLAYLGQMFRRRAVWAPTAGVALVWSLVLGLTFWNVEAESEGFPPLGERSGLYALALGKWPEQTVSATLHPPTKDQTFDAVSQIWARLRQEDPAALVLSVDSRAWYIPQRVLSAAEDARAVRAYLAGDASAQRAALWSVGVRFVLTRPEFDPYHHVLNEIGPWQDLDRRPDLYRLVFQNAVAGLYALVPTPAELGTHAGAKVSENQGGPG